ncbi:hypothetical protein VTK26DRAFT_8062 [Humicola hyalothermophila]
MVTDWLALPDRERHHLTPRGLWTFVETASPNTTWPRNWIRLWDCFTACSVLQNCDGPKSVLASFQSGFVATLAKPSSARSKPDQILWSSPLYIVCTSANQMHAWDFLAEDGGVVSSRYSKG